MANNPNYEAPGQESREQPEPPGSASDLAWTRNLMRMMAPQGVWAVPRSGLFFQKTAENALALIEAAKADRSFREYQIQDYRLIQRVCQKAGITVTTKLKGFEPKA